MGLEGAVRLGYRKELEALPDGPQRQALFEELLARQVANGSAVQMATTLEIDAVIDPADTRHWLAQGLASARTETTAPRASSIPGEQGAVRRRTGGRVVQASSPKLVVRTPALALWGAGWLMLTQNSHTCFMALRNCANSVGLAM
ncbi:Acetyl/propionyl-CoA carboxylase, alpha subunit [Hydrogenophaga sp. T4]|nr:Acetyl/propionyl-CoA carboxylase, alpha subunit [Hydrogenophaga sp. T4]